MILDEKIYVLDLNPEPWEVGKISSGRKNNKTWSRIAPVPNLVAYQNAVREVLEGQEFLPWDKIELTFFFWRQQARYLDQGDKIRQRNIADATNMQKALEDALQGVLFKNDRSVKDIHSLIVEEGPEVEPKIVIRARQGDPFLRAIQELPPAILERVRQQAFFNYVPETWGDEEDSF